MIVGKQMHFCTHHNRLHCKRIQCARINEIGVKVLEELGSDDHNAILEDYKVGLPNYVKERENEALEVNESIASKPICAKMQVEEINSSSVARKLVMTCIIHTRRSRSKDATFRKSTTADIDVWAQRHCNPDDVEDSEGINKLIAREKIKSPMSTMILISDKSMLKLLHNSDLQLILVAVRGAACNH